MQLTIVGIFLAARMANPQSVVLKGKVTDAATRTGISGADVTVNYPGGKTLSNVTEKDGSYVVDKLNRGGAVCVLYSRNGYRPNPRSETIQLNSAEVTENVELYENTALTAYWTDWSTGVKSSVEISIRPPGQQTLAYDRAWSSLSKYGLSPQAQSKAAHSLIVIAPEATYSQKLRNASYVTDEDIAKATNNLRAAAAGETRLSRGYFIVSEGGQVFLFPTEFAAQIAADELKKEPASPTTHGEFVDDFGSIWGTTGSHDLKMFLDVSDHQSCQTELVEPKHANHKSLEKP